MEQQRCFFTTFQDVYFFLFCGSSFIMTTCVVGAVDHMLDPKRGGHKTPCTDIKGLQQLLMVLDSKVAHEYRQILNTLFLRYMAGDHTMISEIEENATSAEAVHILARDALDRSSTAADALDRAAAPKRSLEQVECYHDTFKSLLMSAEEHMEDSQEKKKFISSTLNAMLEDSNRKSLLSHQENLLSYQERFLSNQERFLSNHESLFNMCKTAAPGMDCVRYAKKACESFATCSFGSTVVDTLKSSTVPDALLEDARSKTIYTFCHINLLVGGQPLSHKQAEKAKSYMVTNYRGLHGCYPRSFGNGEYMYPHRDLELCKGWLRIWRADNGL